MSFLNRKPKKGPIGIILWVLYGITVLWSGIAGYLYIIESPLRTIVLVTGWLFYGMAVYTHFKHGVERK